MGLLNPGDSSTVAILRRNVEGGGRQDDIRHTSFRTVLGLKGDFAKVWSYDAFMQTSKVIYQETYKNEFSLARGARALDVVQGPTGPVCRSFLDGTDPNCVPYNLWSLGKITPEALSYIQTPGFQSGSTEQMVQGVSLSADLSSYGWKLPSAKNGVSVAFGLERRVEKLQLDTDTAFSTGDLAGQGGPTIGTVGKYTVKEIYGEIRAPLIEGREFADLLSINGSYRHSDYSIDQKTDSYGAGIEWAPVKMFRARGSLQRAVRAPNIHELFDQQSIGLYDNDEDPCAGPTPTATLAQCARTGVTAAQYGKIVDSPAGQYNQLQGGNPNLKPETSDSYTLGMVFEPSKDFSATIDYFNIKVKDQISTLPSTIVLQQCIDTGALCNLITRDQAGTLWLLPTARIVATNLNIADQSTSGIDFGLNYNYRLQGYGSFMVNFIGTWLKNFETDPGTGSGTYDCAGLYGPTCGTPLPEWRHKLRGTWSTPWNFDLSLTWRYIGSVDVSSSSSNPNLTGTVNQVEKTFDAVNYFDLAGSWAVTKQLTLRGGINNLLDQDPPLSSVVGAGFGNGNTYPQVYDALGRRIFMNLTYKF